jgi:hypothetical protein
MHTLIVAKIWRTTGCCRQVCTPKLMPQSANDKYARLWLQVRRSGLPLDAYARWWRHVHWPGPPSDTYADTGAKVS